MPCTAVQESKFGGDDLDKIVEKLYFIEKKKEACPHYALKGLPPHTTKSYHRYHQLQLVEDVRKALCSVSDRQLDFDKKGQILGGTKIPPLSYELPDKTQIKVGLERFSPYEALFNPRVFIDDAQLSDFSGIQVRRGKPCVSDIQIRYIYIYIYPRILRYLCIYIYIIYTYRPWLTRLSKQAMSTFTKS